MNTEEIISDELLKELRNRLICPPCFIDVLCQFYKGDYLAAVSVKPFSYIPFIPTITNPFESEDFQTTKINHVDVGFTRTILKLESNELTQNDINLAIALLSERGVHTHEYIEEQRRLHDPNERMRMEYEEKRQWYQTPEGKRELRNQLRQTLKELVADFDPDGGILQEIRSAFYKLVVGWLDEMDGDDKR